MSNESTSEMTNFVRLSAVLTGFNQSIVAPALDPVDIKSTYLKVWKEHIDAPSKPADLSIRILSQFAELSTKQPKPSDEALGEAMLDESNGTEFVFACRQLIFLWYMGAWPQVTEQPDSETRGSTSFVTISSASYTSGLVWKVMQSHPMGDSNYRYGYWAEQPADLNSYTGNTDDIS